MFPLVQPFQMVVVIKNVYSIATNDNVIQRKTSHTFGHTTTNAISVLQFF